MAPMKLRCPTTCADCGAPDSAWVSLNRAVLVCSECCSIHRSLGRHITQIKSIKKAIWNPAQFQMVNTLYSSGSNTIWEHSLLDPGSKSIKRKPNPQDLLHPTKAEFIRTKYEKLSFLFKPGKLDSSGPDTNDEDVSKQLHSTVRTANLEISLRLLSQGADPNYFHTEKGNAPMHVAAKAGQPQQVELLAIYGGDPGAPDYEGHTPEYYARCAGFFDLADRIVELQHELTDRLAYYVCNRKPDHANGQHFIIPEMVDGHCESNESTKIARSKLQALPSPLLEELAIDVYDEVDRRETENHWVLAVDHTNAPSRSAVPFLPLHPDYSSVRNQGRQKLARFNPREFATLIIDILSEIKRREHGGSFGALFPTDIPTQRNSTNSNKHCSNTSSTSNSELAITAHSGASYSLRSDAAVTRSISLRSTSDGLRSSSTSDDGEPLYDTVASDDENSLEKKLEDIGLEEDSDASVALAAGGGVSLETPGGGASVEIPGGGVCLETTGSRHSDVVAVVPETVELNVTSHFSFKASQPVASRAKTTSVVSPGPNSSKTGGDQGVDLADFRMHFQSSERRINDLTIANVELKNEIGILQNMVYKVMKENSTLQSRLHCCIPDSHYPHHHRGYIPPPSAALSYVPYPSDAVPPPPPAPNNYYYSLPAPQFSPRGSPRLSQRPQSMFEGRQGRSFSTSVCEGSDDDYGYNVPIYSSVTERYDRSASVTGPRLSTPPPPPVLVRRHSEDSQSHLPTAQQVADKTSVVTKQIETLFLCAQDGRHNRFMMCADSVFAAVLDLTTLFPQGKRDDRYSLAIRQLMTNASKLKNECHSLMAPQDAPTDHSYVTDHVVQYAYDVANSAKQLVLLFQL